MFTYAKPVDNHQPKVDNDKLIIDRFVQENPLDLNTEEIKKEKRMRFKEVKRQLHENTLNTESECSNFFDERFNDFVMTNNSSINMCSVCKESNIITHYLHDKAEKLVCQTCGTIVDYSCDNTNDDTNFTYSTHYSSNQTSMCLRSDSYGMSGVAQFQKIINGNSIEKARSTIHKELDDISRKYMIKANIMDDAKCLYANYCNYDILLRADNRWGVIAACLYYAFESNKCPKSREEITKMFNIEMKFLNRGCDLLHNKLIIKHMPITNEIDNYVKLLNKEKNLPCKYNNIIKEKVTQILHNMEKIEENFGRQPESLLVVIIIIMVKEYGITLSKAEISKYFNKSFVTVDAIQAKFLHKVSNNKTYFENFQNDSFINMILQKKKNYMTKLKKAWIQWKVLQASSIQ